MVASSANPTCWSAVAVGMVTVFTSGFVIFLPLALVLNSAEPDRLFASTEHRSLKMALMASAVLVGVGSGTTLQSMLSRRFGSHVASRMALCLTAVGLILVSRRTDMLMLLGCVTAGLGYSGEWTANAQQIRSALSTRHRWSGLRVFGLLLFCGAALAVILTGSSFILSGGLETITGCSAVACCVLAVFVCQLHTEQTEAAEKSGSSSDGASDRPFGEGEQSGTPVRGWNSADAVPSAQQCGAKPVTGTAQIFADECCGGGLTWRPIPLWIGAAIAATGAFAVWGLLIDRMVEQVPVTVLMMITSAAGGVCLFQATVSGTGYAVLLLPFLLLLPPLVCAVVLADSSGFSWVIECALSAVVGGIFHGCSQLVGESFSDSCRDIGLSAVLLVGNMLAAALVLATGPLAMLFLPPEGVVLLKSGLLGSAVLLLRRIPSPVVSGRPSDTCAGDEDTLMTEVMPQTGGSVE